MKSIRLWLYPLLFVLPAMAIHFWITEPLFWKKLPFRIQAAKLSVTQLGCDPGAPAGLSSLLTRHALPNFSHSAAVFYIDTAGERSGCQVSPKGKMGAVFRLASMTKAVTAHAVLGLAAQGRLGLDDPLLKYFPEVDTLRLQDNRLLQVTLAELLNHSSGFGGLWGSDNMVNKGQQPWCPYNFKKLESVRLAGQPGTNHVYSNVAYCLLGEVISRVTEMPYREYIRAHYLVNYPELDFVDGGYLPGEPEYDFSNDFKLGKDYVSWLDFGALSSAAGLIGSPEAYADMAWHFFHRDAREMLAGPLVVNCGNDVIARCYSWNFELLFDEEGAIVAGVQHGYLPGASSMLMIAEDGGVLVWVAAGAAILPDHKKALTEAAAAFLKKQ